MRGARWPTARSSQRPSWQNLISPRMLVWIYLVRIWLVLCFVVSCPSALPRAPWLSLASPFADCVDVFDCRTLWSAAEHAHMIGVECGTVFWFMINCSECRGCNQPENLSQVVACAGDARSLCVAPLVASNGRIVTWSVWLCHR